MKEQSLLTRVHHLLPAHRSQVTPLTTIEASGMSIFSSCHILLKKHQKILDSKVLAHKTPLILTSLTLWESWLHAESAESFHTVLQGDKGDSPPNPGPGLANSYTRAGPCCGGGCQDMQLHFQSNAGAAPPPRTLDFLGFEEWRGADI